jgi:competence protein ComEA
LGLGAVIVVMLVALAVTVGIGILRGRAAPTQEVAVTARPTPSASVAVYVHVSGAVRKPGLYVLPAAARLVDAVAAAGGFAKDAARDGVNLARPVADGEQVIVPRKGEAPPATAGGAASGPAVGAGAAPAGKVNLNTADAAALDSLPRVGPAIAQRIIDWRTQNGRFTSVEDLLAVPGIGEKMLASLRDLVTV